jgi:hypothetical protein
MKKKFLLVCLLPFIASNSEAMKDTQEGALSSLELARRFLNTGTFPIITNVAKKAPLTTNTKQPKLSVSSNINNANSINKDLSHNVLSDSTSPSTYLNELSSNRNKPTDGKSAMENELNELRRQVLRLSNTLETLHHEWKTFLGNKSAEEIAREFDLMRVTTALLPPASSLQLQQEYKTDTDEEPVALIAEDSSEVNKNDRK